MPTADVYRLQSFQESPLSNIIDYVIPALTDVASLAALDLHIIEQESSLLKDTDRPLQSMEILILREHGRKGA